MMPKDVYEVPLRYVHQAGTPAFSQGDFSLRAAPTILASAAGQYYVEYTMTTTPPAPRAVDPAKPPYVVPSMAEIRALPWNGFNVVSTFSGSGGSSLGYKLAGYKVLWANEFVPQAQDTYRANHLDTQLDTRDIRDVTPADVLRATGLAAGELDLFDGSPPCASFSMAGKREKLWGQVKDYSTKTQRTDDLFFEYARLLKGIQPRTFVAENVAGLVKGTAKGYFIRILEALRQCGYRVEAQVLDAQWLGVPQRRQRVIFMGVRNDLGLAPVFPKPFPYRYTVKDALPNARLVRIGPEWRPADQVPAGTVMASDGKRENTSHTATFSSYLLETFTPIERRQFLIDEIRLLCSFPADFVLTGGYAAQWERMGRAVPPLMMKAMAAAVRDQVLVPLRERGVI